MRIRYVITFATAPAVLAATAAHAEPGNASGKMLDALSECRKITNDTSRLACFDRFAASFESALKSENIKIVDRNDVTNIKKSLFGFALPKVDLFGSKEPFVEINTTVVSARPIASNRMQLMVAEGDATWQTTDPMDFPPKPGSKIRIRKGALGNYFLSIDGVSYRGMRVK